MKVRQCALRGVTIKADALEVDDVRPLFGPVPFYQGFLCIAADKIVAGAVGGTNAQERVHECVVNGALQAVALAKAAVVPGVVAVPQLGIAIAFMKDPWGTNIEMTEGLANIKYGWSYKNN